MWAATPVYVTTKVDGDTNTLLYDLGDTMTIAARRRVPTYTYMRNNITTVYCILHQLYYVGTD